MLDQVLRMKESSYCEDYAFFYTDCICLLRPFLAMTKEVQYSYVGMLYQLCYQHFAIEGYSIKNYANQLISFSILLAFLFL